MSGDLDRAVLFYELHDHYARYAASLDDGPLEQWPDFFTEECRYEIIPRDNFELGLPVAVMRCESRGMLADRVTAVLETMMFEPRYLRHHITDLRIESASAAGAETRANFSIIEVLPDELPRIAMVGHYRDRLERSADGQWRFREKLAIFDSVLVANTIVVPV